MPFSAILLAAGRSRRMGAQKALLTFDGRVLIDYQLAQLGACEEIEEIIVVTGDRAEALLPHIKAAPRARAAHNPDFDSGKVSSIRRGLGALSSDVSAIVLLAVDQPRPAAIIRRLLEAQTSAGALITMPEHQAHGGHPVIFDATLLPELRGIDEASLGVRAVMERHGSEINRVVSDDPIVCVDINTPEDLERARGMLDLGAAIDP